MFWYFDMNTGETKYESHICPLVALADQWHKEMREAQYDVMYAKMLSIM